MKVAYIFTTPTSQKILETMIIPQLEEKRHGVDVVGMFFFMDNTFFLLKGTQMGERLKKLHDETGMLLMACDQCAYERHIADKLVDGAGIGCFPDLYKALGPAAPDQVITL
ncbi:MAG: DsrE-related protein SaoD [Chloroflexota bacterium]